MSRLCAWCDDPIPAKARRDVVCCSVRCRQARHRFLRAVGHAEQPTLPGRVIGTKPAAVCRWIFTLLGAAPGDSLDDLFPGSGAVGRAWATFTSSPEPALWE